MTEPENPGPKLFTVETANALLPFLRDRLSRFQALFAEYEVCRRGLTVLRLVSASGGGRGNPDLLRLRAEERREKSLLQRMRAIQAEILDAGCVPKSYRKGLVDFFALRGDRLVFLCWKQGEDSIQAWHSVEDGLSGRIPIARFTEEGSRRERDGGS